MDTMKAFYLESAEVLILLAQQGNKAFINIDEALGEATGGAGDTASYRDKRTCRKCFFSNDRLTVLGHRAKGIKRNPDAENTHWLRKEG